MMTARATGSAHRDRCAWRSPVAWIVLLVVAVLGLGIDLAGKSWSYRVVPDEPVTLDRARLLADPNYDPLRWHPSMEIVPNGWIDLKLVLNPGAVFGIGANQRWFFIVFTALALATAVFVFAKHTTTSMRLSHVGIGLVLAGGLGNLFDRVFIGRVRDFIHLLPDRRLPFDWRWPGTNNPELMPWVFNLADVMLLLGMLLLLYHLRRRDRRRRLLAAQPDSTAATDPVPVVVPIRDPRAAISADDDDHRRS
jgi:signal peptidase II